MEPTGLSQLNMYTTAKRITSTQTWTAPAGVTSIMIAPDYLITGVGTILTVVPNTSYSITVSNALSTFGSLYQFRTYDVDTSTGQYFWILWTE